jgi:hypothetical protein
MKRYHLGGLNLENIKINFREISFHGVNCRPVEIVRNELLTAVNI